MVFGGWWLVLICDGKADFVEVPISQEGDSITLQVTAKSNLHIAATRGQWAE